MSLAYEISQKLSQSLSPCRLLARVISTLHALTSHAPKSSTTGYACLWDVGARVIDRPLVVNLRPRARTICSNSLHMNYWMPHDYRRLL
jgi:hypothetical protein